MLAFEQNGFDADAQTVWRLTYRKWNPDRQVWGSCSCWFSSWDALLEHVERAKAKKETKPENFVWASYASGLTDFVPCE